MRQKGEDKFIFHLTIDEIFEAEKALNYFKSKWTDFFLYYTFVLGIGDLDRCSHFIHTAQMTNDHLPMPISPIFLMHD